MPSGGVPAKVLKFRWSVDEVIEHESMLYPEEARMPKEIFEANAIAYGSK